MLPTAAESEYLWHVFVCVRVCVPVDVSERARVLDMYLWMRGTAVCCSVLQCVAMRCSVLQCAAVCCSVLQCVAVCWIFIGGFDRTSAVYWVCIYVRVCVCACVRVFVCVYVSVCLPVCLSTYGVALVRRID